MLAVLEYLLTLSWKTSASDRHRPVICLPREPLVCPTAPRQRRCAARSRARRGWGGGRGTPRALARDAVLPLVRRASEWPPTATATVPPAAPLPPCRCCLLPAPARAGRKVCDRVVTPRVSCVCRAGQGDDELYEGFNSSPPPQAPQHPWTLAPALARTLAPVSPSLEVEPVPRPQSGP